MANMSNHVTVKVDGTERFLRALKDIGAVLDRVAQELEAMRLAEDEESNESPGT